MLYVTSAKTKKKYAIGELTFTAVSDSRAITYSNAIPGDTSLFQALKSTAAESTTGVPSTTIQIVDTEIAA